MVGMVGNRTPHLQLSRLLLQPLSYRPYTWYTDNIAQVTCHFVQSVEFNDYLSYFMPWIFYISDQFHNRHEPHNEYMTTARICQILMVGHHPEELTSKSPGNALVSYSRMCYERVFVSCALDNTRAVHYGGLHILFVGLIPVVKLVRNVNHPWHKIA